MVKRKLKPQFIALIIFAATSVAIVGSLISATFNKEVIIFTANTDTTSVLTKIEFSSDNVNTTQITDPRNSDWFFSWSEKKDKIIFCSKKGDNFDVFSINTNGTELKNLTNSPEEEHTPAISPDGKYIVYTTHKHNVQSIYRMESDGSNKVRITKNYDYMAAKFSPDSSKLLLIRRFYKNPSRIEFYISNINGEKMRKMDPLRMGHEDPSFSRDGKTILFSAVDPNLLSWQIFKVDSDGKNFKRLTAIKKGNFFAPIFSPDESEIIYTRRQSLEEKASLWLMNADGSNQRQITSDEIMAGDGSFIDRNTILATIKKGYGQWQIAVLSRDGKMLNELTGDGSFNSVAPRLFRRHYPY